MKSLPIRLQLGFGFGVMALLVLISSAMIWRETAQSEVRSEVARHGTVGAVSLAAAQSALWQLRYGFPQFMVSDEAARKKIVEDEPKFRAVIDQALSAYAASNPSAEERKSLQALQEVYGKYMDARPKWFALYGEGKIEQAKDWRAATTTPLGAATVKAFSELIDLQQKASLDNHVAGLGELQATRRTMLVLALTALAAALAIALTITRGLAKELGGEPLYAKQVAARIASGDLGSEVVVRKGDTSSLLWTMKSMRDDLSAVVGDVVGSARKVSDTSAQIAQGNVDLSQRTEEQASTLEETASSMEELTSTVTQNADNARQASQFAVGASEVARKGGLVVGQVVRTMTDISESSRKISDIISVIDGIAFQTNILALNAAVEAARAGEQGRGFAVVAAEVRNLAQRSASAAKEIKSLIGDSVSKVDAGTKLVDAAGKTMDEIVVSVKQVTDLITEIAAACQEQSGGIEQVNTAIMRMDQGVQQNASLVEEATAAAELMKEQAGLLVQMVSKFNLGGDLDGSASSVASSAPVAKRIPVPAPIKVRDRARDTTSTAGVPSWTGIAGAPQFGDAARKLSTANGTWKQF